MNAQRMRGGALRRFVAAACASLALLAAPAAAFAGQTYQVYPTPQSIEYTEGEVTLPESVNVVLDPGVDAETERRLNETLALKNITANKVDAPGKDANAVEVLVGINGSKGAVDQLVQSGAVAPQAELFGKLDANFVAVQPKGKDAPARIVVVGRDTDAAFYGLSTLYQVFQQVEGRSLAAFTVNDWADVETRGFIEGYYGNPWTTEDRVELMRWGGMFKQNAYIYAPKDDPKHNAEWRALYTPEELAKITQLAQAGNASKCRFVYALHPFMNDKITFGASYEKDLETLKAKYLQVINAGCRQIMLSADDARTPGADNYKRLLTDLTNWLHDLQKMENEDGSLKYPGLKDTIPFVEDKYYDAGASGWWYNTLPENVRVITTGKQVWGKADKSTIDTFKSRTGVAPFMWINWPCTDNTRDHLSMGGYENALGADVTPGSLVGCVINPMQQSEPSKVGIFLNADFSWNNWESYDHADKVWSDAFSFVDHNTPADNDASNALRTLSEHMKWYQGGGATFESRESEAVKPMLDAFRAKVEDGSVKVADIDQIETLFKEIQAATSTYVQNAGNASLRTQIEPWLGFWTDGMNAGMRYLAALRAHLNGDEETLVIEYTQGKEQFDSALLHSFPYVKDTQYARAGTRAVWPVVEALGEFLRPVVGNATGTVDVVAEVSLKGLGTSGNPANIVDGDTETYAHFSGSNPTTNVNVGDSFTITYEPYQRADAVTFVQSVPSNRPQDVLKDALVEYTTDGSTWVELGHVNGDAEQTLELPKTTDLKGLRFTNKQYYNGYWQVNEVATSMVAAKPFKPFASQDPAQGELSAFVDGNAKTGASFDVSAKGMNAGLNYVKTTEVGTIEIAQGKQARSGKVEALVGGVWTEVGTFDAKDAQTVALDKNTAVNGVRLVIDGEGAWDLNEITVKRLPSKVAPVMNETMAVYQTFTLDKIADGNESSYAHLKNEKDNNIRANDWVGLTFEPAARIGKITFVQDADGGDVIVKGKVEYQAEDGSWHKVGDVTSAKKQTFEFANVNAKAIRVTNLENTAKWWKVFELTAEEGYESPAGAVVTDIEGAVLAGTASSTSAAINTGKVTIPAGSHVAVDLASVQANVAIDAASAKSVADAGLELVSSVNGLSWDAVEGEAVAAARYVGVRNASDHEIAFDFGAHPFSVTFPGVSGDFTSDSAPVDEAHGTTAMLDGRVTTYWRPANAAGTLTYHVSAPLSGELPRNGVRFVSWGNPSGAQVSATVYDKPDYSSTTEVELGALDGSVRDFAFAEAANGRFWGVKEIHVTWSEGQVPSIAEVSMLDTTFEPQPLPEMRTVTFMVDDVVFAQVEVEDGAAVSKPENDPAKEGFAFNGWYLGESAYDFAAPVTDDLTLTARFTPKDDQGGQGENPAPGPDDKPGTNPGDKPVDKPAGRPGAGLPQTGDAAMLAVAGASCAATLAIAGGVALKKREQQ
ncbi:MAG: beta-N-acetylglucosaminidase domain-containing protein [Coriobacteriaceae bacterium]|nr:beta-N-acetylglucosaminidase domain-containing protein [Coriobacteriaceae bacterium]